MLAIALIGCRTESYVLAKGVGSQWVVVEFGNRECKPMESRWLGRDFLIPASGYLCTSSPVELGLVFERYYKLTDDGRRERLEESKNIHGRSALNLTLEGCQVTAVVFRYGSEETRPWDSGAFISQYHPECRGSIAWPADTN